MTRRTRAALGRGIVQIIASAVEIMIKQDPQQVLELKAVILWAADIQHPHKGKPRMRIKADPAHRRPH